MGLAPIETKQSLTVKDTILYALGVGAGGERPTDPDELRYVYEEGLTPLPTMAVVLAYPGFWAKDPRYKLTWRKALHGEQSIEIHKPLPVSGDLVGITKIDEVYDKGSEKGAILCSSRRIYLSSSGDCIATVRQSLFLRADGGFGGKAEGAPKPHPLPSTPPDLTVTAPTRADQALLYRLSGDNNPLHADPVVAAQAGFSRPILHGLATFGVTGRALYSALLQNRAEKVRRVDVRFSSPVYPGETLSVDIWRQEAGVAAFRAKVVERDVIVLQNGRMEFEP